MLTKLMLVDIVIMEYNILIMHDSVTICHLWNKGDQASG